MAAQETTWIPSRTVVVSNYIQLDDVDDDDDVDDVDDDVIEANGALRKRESFGP